MKCQDVVFTPSGRSAVVFIHNLEPSPEHGISFQSLKTPSLDQGTEHQRSYEFQRLIFIDLYLLRLDTKLVRLTQVYPYGFRSSNIATEVRCIYWYLRPT